MINATMYVNIRSICVYIGFVHHGGSRGLMDRALDLKPEVTQGCGFGLWQEVSTTEVRPLSKALNPQLLHLDGLNAENTFHSSLYSV